MKYICTSCGYLYNPDAGDLAGGIPPGTPFEALPEEWICPVCYVGREQFDPLE